MNIESSWALKGPQNLSEELFFNDTELTIQRNSKGSWLNIAIGLLLALSSAGNCINFHGHENQVYFYLSAVVLIIAVLLLIYGFFSFYKAREMNKRTFAFAELKEVRADVYNTIAGISFEFKDGTKDRISIVKTGYYSLLKEVLKKNSIELIENIKR
jgi:hypothetical protein